MRTLEAEGHRYSRARRARRRPQALGSRDAADLRQGVSPTARTPRPPTAASTTPRARPSTRWRARSSTRPTAGSARKNSDFVDDMVRWCARREPSEKQAKWLHASTAGSDDADDREAAEAEIAERRSSQPSRCARAAVSAGALGAVAVGMAEDKGPGGKWTKPPRQARDPSR